VFFDPIRRGAEAAGRSLAEIDLTVSVGLEITDDVEESARRHARGYAFTFGAMGSVRHNFYKDAFTRQGFGEDVDEVQRLWREGDREAAAQRVPLDIGLKTNLLGTREMITQRLRLYRDAGLTTLRVGLGSGALDTQLESLEVLMKLVDAVNAEQNDGRDPSAP
jgi:alkanesulfonate monooxygenase SsuD/methylene tetrahydromethanopterin reductase-like flavin-dependent oxidoreductase (luciferase family)